MDNGIRSNMNAFIQYTHTYTRVAIIIAYPLNRKLHFVKRNCTCFGLLPAHCCCCLFIEYVNFSLLSFVMNYFSYSKIFVNCWKLLFNRVSVYLCKWLSIALPQLQNYYQKIIVNFADQNLIFSYNDHLNRKSLCVWIHVDFQNYLIFIYKYWTMWKRIFLVGI